MDITLFNRLFLFALLKYIAESRLYIVLLLRVVANCNILYYVHSILLTFVTKLLNVVVCFSDVQEALA